MAIRRRMRFAAPILILIAILSPSAISSRRSVADKDQLLYEGARIHILANVVRPLDATCEQYPYFDFPFCPPGEPLNNRTSLFEDLLSGDCYTNTQYELRFKNNTARKILCERSLSKDEVAKFRNAVKKRFVYHMAYHKGVLKGEVGRIEEEEEEPKYYLATHITFYIKYYKHRVTDVFIMRDPDTDVDITKVAKIKVNFTYSVLWERTIPSNLTQYEGNERASDDNGSLMYLFVFWADVALVWAGVLLMVTLPYLMSYFFRYSNKEEEDSDILGPRRTHSDSCDFPRYISFLGAILGNGTQLFIMVCIFFILAFKGYLHPCNLQLLCSQILRTYCFTSVVAGYKATSFHARFTQVGWKECIFQAATIYFIPVLVTALVANGLAVTKTGISNSSELSIIFENLLPRELISIVVLTLGGIVAHFAGPESRPSSATTKVPREISHQPWYMKTPIQMLFSCFVTSAVIFPEMDNIYASLWNLKMCGAFHSMLNSFAVVVTLTMVTAGVFTMAKRDHQWWWRSVFRGGSPAIFMFAYGIYFFSRIDMDEGLLIRVVGYSACISYALFLILGTISFYTSFFVSHFRYSLQKHE